MHRITRRIHIESSFVALTLFFAMVLPLNTLAADMQDETLDLRLHMAKGDEYQATIIIDRATTRWDDEKETTETALFTLVLIFEVLDIDDQDNVIMKMTSKRYATQSQNQDTSFAFDSDALPEKGDGTLAVNAACVGQSVHLKLSPRSEVLAIENFAGLHAAMMDTASTMKEPLIARTSASIAV